MSLVVSKGPFADLTDVTLAYTILTDNANRAIQGNVAMQVVEPGGQVCSGATWWPILEPMQVAWPSPS
jgi:hypothetical protein